MLKVSLRSELFAGPEDALDAADLDQHGAGHMPDVPVEIPVGAVADELQLLPWRQGYGLAGAAAADDADAGPGVDENILRREPVVPDGREPARRQARRRGQRGRDVGRREICAGDLAG